MLSQEQAAERLGITQGVYAKYETRSFMPHRLIARFCQITGEKPESLFSISPPSDGG